MLIKYNKSASFVLHILSAGKPKYQLQKEHLNKISSLSLSFSNHNGDTYNFIAILKQSWPKAFLSANKKVKTGEKSRREEVMQCLLCSLLVFANSSNCSQPVMNKWEQERVVPKTSMDPLSDVRQVKATLPSFSYLTNKSCNKIIF